MKTNKGDLSGNAEARWIRLEWNDAQRIGRRGVNVQKRSYVKTFQLSKGEGEWAIELCRREIVQGLTKYQTKNENRQGRFVWKFWSQMNKTGMKWCTEKWKTCLSIWRREVMWRHFNYLRENERLSFWKVWRRKEVRRCDKYLRRNKRGTNKRVVSAKNQRLGVMSRRQVV